MRWIRDSLRPAFVMLGADLDSLSAVRLHRLPCCERLGKEDEHGTFKPFENVPHIQRLLYLNPEPLVCRSCNRVSKNESQQGRHQKSQRSLREIRRNEDPSPALPHSRAITIESPREYRSQKRSGNSLQSPPSPKGSAMPKRKPLLEYGDIPPDIVKTLLGNRFLCVEGGLLFIGPSGIGKSSASIQQDIRWSIGEPAFGIAPTRPLKIVTIQAEDDAGDLSEMVQGACLHLELSPEQDQLSRENCAYYCHKQLTGPEFLANVVDRFSPGTDRTLLGLTRSRLSSAAMSRMSPSCPDSSAMA